MTTGLSTALAVAMASGAAVQAAPPAAEPYRDRIIAPENLEPLPPDDESGFDASGPPRSWHVEFGLSRSEYAGGRFTESGVAFGGFRETARHGSLSFDASLFHGRGARAACQELPCRDDGALATLWQRGLHLDGGWRLDNGVGVLNSPLLPLQRSQHRFLLPSVAFAGASTEWHNEARGIELQAAYGRAGRYSGTRTAGFDVAEGDVASLGAQWVWAPGWSGAASYLATFGRIRPGELGEPLFEAGSTRALHLSTVRLDEQESLQFNMLGSDADGGGAIGAWIDGRRRSGRYEHRYGAYRLDPGLAWGAFPIHNDAAGGYYRAAYSYGRWQWQGGADLLRPLSGRRDAIAYATGYARYQAGSALAYGASLSLREASQRAYALQGFVDRHSNRGKTRFQIDQARSAGDDQWQLAADHALALRQGSRLSLSLGLGRLAYRNEGVGDARDATRTATFALNGGHDLTDRLQLDGSARWTYGEGDTAVRGVDLNLGIDWRFAPRWSLVASIYQSQGSRRSPFILDPLVTRTPYIALPRERTLLLTLRHAYEAGRPQGVLGGVPGAANGSLRGSVFLDENRNGVREASELPAINITVLLDGRYSVRTDSDGRFEFPRVAVGTHTLSVESDNLPLPWSFDDGNASRTIEVEVRETAYVDLGARRPL